MISGRLFSVGLRQLLSRQELGRVPERESVSSGHEQALHYSQALETPMSVVYGLALDVLKGAWPGEAPRSMLEICSGPGLFSALAARYLRPANLVGIDLSESMLAQARSAFEGAPELSGTRAEFLKLDALGVGRALAGRKFELVLFMNGAHHLEGPAQVREVIGQASSLCEEEGMVFILDPIRPRSEGILRSYGDTVHSLYLDPGLTEFYSDFVQSLHASYTAEEFGELVPAGTGRRWFHWAPRLVPATQILIGISGRSFRPRYGPRYGMTRGELHEVLPRPHRLIYSLMKLDFKLGRLKEVAAP